MHLRKPMHAHTHIQYETCKTHINNPVNMHARTRTHTGAHTHAQARTHCPRSGPGRAVQQARTRVRANTHARRRYLFNTTAWSSCTSKHAQRNAHRHTCTRAHRQTQTHRRRHISYLLRATAWSSCITGSDFLVLLSKCVTNCECVLST
jgi:hypothetical protein